MAGGSVLLELKTSAKWSAFAAEFKSQSPDDVFKAGMEFDC